MGRDSVYNTIKILTHESMDPILESSQIASRNENLKVCYSLENNSQQNIKQTINNQLGEYPNPSNMDCSSIHHIDLEDNQKDNCNQGNHSTTIDKAKSRHGLRQLSIHILTKAQKLAKFAADGIYHSRMLHAERTFNLGSSLIDMDIPYSKRTESFLDHERTLDDSFILSEFQSKSFDDLLMCSKESRRNFFLTRICDPTSYFYKYRFNYVSTRKPLHAQIELVEITWLKAHEQVVSWDRVARLKKSILKRGAYTQALLVDRETGAILDGHHRYHVGRQLGARRLPCVLVDYLSDDSISVDVWAECGREFLTKHDVIEMALSDNLFPPKTSRHKFSDNLPPIYIPLKDLEFQSLDMTQNLTCVGKQYSSSDMITQQVRRLSCDFNKKKIISSPLKTEEMSEFSLKVILNCSTLGFKTLRSILRNRIRESSSVIESGKCKLDVRDGRCRLPDGNFQKIRANDPTSSFCKQSAKTFEDLLSSNYETRQNFFISRVADFTSYFYNYHFDIVPPRQPKRLHVELVDIAWLKPHEQVVSFERVSALRRATLKWDAYTEPLLVDRTSGAILDGHHRYNVGLQLGISRVPAVLVNYLEDPLITVDVWPDCELDSISKEDVINMSLSDHLYPPKTSRHRFSNDLPPISVSLSILRRTTD